MKKIHILTLVFLVGLVWFGALSPRVAEAQSIGNLIEISNDLRVTYVKASPSDSGNILRDASDGDRGTIVDGPGGTTWWYISFDQGKAGTDGWVRQSQFRVLTSQPTPSTKFRIGDRVETATTFDVKKYPNSGTVGSQASGAKGAVTGGPISAGGKWWWKVDYDTGADGWSKEELFTAGQANVPPPSAGGDFTLSSPAAGATYQKGAYLIMNWGKLWTSQYYWPVGITVKLFGPYNDPLRGPSERVIATLPGSVYDPVSQDYSVDSGIGVIIASDVKDGLYVVKVIVDYNGNGSDRTSVSGAFTISGTVQPAIQPPVVNNFVYTGQTVAIAGNNLTFQIQATDPENNSLSYLIAWGDGTSNSTYAGASGQTVTANHIYSQAGTYTARLTATDNQGLNDSEPLTLVVGAPGGDIPTSTPKFSAGDSVGILSGVQNLPVRALPLDSATVLGTRSSAYPSGPGPVGRVTEVRLVGSIYWYKISWEAYNYSPAVEGWSTGEYLYKKAGPGGPSASTTLAIGDRVVVKDYTPVYSGFGQFGVKGVVIDGPTVIGGYTQVKVNYDYGPDAWSIVDRLSSLGHLTGEWAFTSDNILGRKIQPGQGSVFTEAYYYYVEDGQVSMPSAQAQASLPPEALNIITGIQGGWGCQGITEYPPFRRVGYQCSYRRGNQPPVVNLTGPTSTFTNIGGTWRFQATDLEGALASYKVDWGDGSPVTPVSIDGASVTKDVLHTYAQTGNFNIKLTVTDGGGLSAEATLPVQVATPCSTRFRVGDRVKVVNTSAEQDLRVRQAPNGTIAGNKSNGALGTIVGGPSATIGYCWWNINYDQDPDGWSAEGGGGVYWLELVSASNQSGGGITIISPAASDIWHPGDTLTIRWTAPSSVTRVHIYLAGVGLLAENEPNDGVFVWTVPQEFNGQKLEGTSFAIAIYAGNVEAGGINSTSRNFTITTRGSSGGVNSFPGTVGGFAKGCTVKTTANLNVRVAASTGAAVVGTVPLGTEGLIVDGPVSATAYTWWRMDFPGNYDGWSVEDFLLIVSCPSGQQNQPPVINTFAYTGQSVVIAGTNLTFQIQATDPENGVINYSIIWGDGTPNWILIGSSGYTADATHVYSQAGTYTARLTAADNQGLSDSEPLTLIVGVPGGGTPNNQPPTLSGLTSPTSVTVNTSGSWQVTGTDPDDTSLTYTVVWGDGTTNSTYTGASGQAVTISHTYTSTGSKIITVTVSDGRGGTANRTLTITVLAAGGGQPGGSLQVLSPAGGETWIIGEAHLIQWSAPASVTQVFIYQKTRLFDGSLSAGRLLTPNGVSSVSGGTFNWVVSGGGNLIYIIAAGGSYEALSNEFKILPSHKNFQVGSGVKTRSSFSPTVNVRQEPSGSGEPAITGTQPVGSIGSVTGGPVWFSGSANISEGWFWEVDFQSGIDGWLHESVLELAEAGGDQPLAITSDSLINPTAVFVGTSNTWILKTNVPSGAPTGGSLIYDVDWGDGTPKYIYTDSSAYKLSRSATHTYSQASSYNITFKATATGIGGFTGSATKPLNITASYEPPVIVAFQVAGTSYGASGSLNTDWKLQASSLYGGTLTYLVNWGDGAPNSTYTGTSGQVVTASHTYASAAGIKRARLTVTDSNGATASKDVIFTPNLPPVISNLTCPDQFLLRYVLGYITCTFKIDDPEGKNISYTVDWEGDGVVDSRETSLLSGYSHTKSKACSTSLCSPATYNMMLNVTDGAGNASVANKSIVLKNVWDVPSTKFSMDDRVKLKISMAIYRDSSGIPGAFTGYVIGTQYGTIEGGPYWVMYEGGRNGYWAWKVSPVAWLSEDSLEKAP